MPAAKQPLPSLREQLMGAASAAHQLAEEAQRPPWPLNPFPRGVRPGSVTDKVLRLLVARYPRWHEHHELMWRTGASRGGIAWAVRYLAAHQLVRSIPSARHPQYRRYQAVLPIQDKTKTKEFADDADHH